MRFSASKIFQEEFNRILVKSLKDLMILSISSSYIKGKAKQFRATLLCLLMLFQG